EDVHRLFKGFVAAHRPELDLEAVATGETWYGEHAVDLKLIDEIVTSDEYLVTHSEEADIYEVHWVEHKRPVERLLAHIESSVDRIPAPWVERITEWPGGV